MELYLQFGYGMMEHCRSLISGWNGGTVILSPRDLNDKQLKSLALDITKKRSGLVLLDPQFYLPHADHERLCSHEYWPDEYETNVFWQGSALTALMTKLQRLNHQLSCSEFILPGMLAVTIDDDWFATQAAIIEEAKGIENDMPLLATIALSADAVRSDEQVASLLEETVKWKADGYYIVCEHPKGNYLVDDPKWLANVLDLVAGLRLQGSRVILGYCNHQMLIAAIAKVTAVASGTWMNVRSFPPDKFRLAYDEEIKQRSTWYYCPQALSEYKIPFLDIAKTLGLLTSMAPPPELDQGYTTNLFSGVQPSSVGFSEQAAFRHYLSCLYLQAQDATKNTFDETVSHHELVLDVAEARLQSLSMNGVRGQLRDFKDIVDVNRAALAVLKSTRGAVLRRKWSQL